jgi:predicted Zn-dependent protease
MAQKRFDAAIERLVLSVKLKPDSAPANYLLGEACLQIKKGSNAVIYLNETLRKNLRVPNRELTPGDRQP